MLLIPGHSCAGMVYYPTIQWMGMTELGVVYGKWMTGVYRNQSDFRIYTQLMSVLRNRSGVHNENRHTGCRAK